MDRLESAVGELVRSTAEAQLQAAEESVAELVRQEVAALAAGRSGTAGSRPSASSTSSASSAPRLSSRLATCSDGPTAPLGPTAMAHVQKTIWEAIILVGLPDLGPVDTVVLVLGFISTLSIQVFICQAIHTGLLWKSPLIVAFADHRWDLHAERARELTAAQGAPLEDNSCSEASGGGTCIRQGNPAGDGRVGSSSVESQEGAAVAAVFCTLAAIGWAVLVGKELWKTHWTTRSMWALPRRSTKILWIGNQLVLGSIGPGRLFLGTVMSLVRLSVAGALFAVSLRQLAIMKSQATQMIIVAVLGFALDVPRRAAAQFIAVQRFKLNLRW